jgi:uncharacterized membrane protein
VSRPRALLWTAVAAYAAGFSALSVLRHASFVTGRFDLGNMVQAVWATAHGHPLAVTDLQGEQISRLGAHFDPLLAAFAPLWWLWPSANMLLVAQAVAIALGAPAVFRLAGKHLGSERTALAFALAYLLYPPVQWLTLDEFHAVALATPLLLWAFWFLDEERLLPFALLAGTACLTKEHVGLAVAGMGAWYALAHGRRRDGIAIAGAGVAVAVLAVGVVIPHFAPHGVSPFEHRYDAVGGSAAGILKTLFTHPLRIVEAATDWRDLAFVAMLLAPLLALPLGAPLAALAALPELGLDLLSSTRTQTSIHFQYTATIVPALVASAVLGAARLRRAGLRVPAAVVVVAALAANFALGAIPLWRAFPGGETLGSREAHVSAHDRVAARAVALVPSGAVVSATNSLGGHLSARRRILSFPLVTGASWIAVDKRHPSWFDVLGEPEPTLAALHRIRADTAWRVVFEEDGVLVLRRRD